jgi:hypothetical protein
MMETVISKSHKHVIVRRACNANAALKTGFALGAIFASSCVMRSSRPDPAALRAEARLLTLAGVILLGIGFPMTLILVAQALAPDGVSPMLPVAVGAPPIMLGYVACSFASQRLVKAKALERR